MSKIKDRMETRCELALMGKVVEVLNENEVQEMTNYILSAMGMFDADSPHDILNEEINKYAKNVVKYIVVNTVEGMRCITYLLESTDTEDGENYYPAPFEEDYNTGSPCAFCYVYNVDCDWYSEFGDCFFKKRSDGFYHRIS